MTTTIAPEIAAFAAAVRAQLADLPPDELDELTDGLEADLTDRVTDAPDAALPDPAEYAAELRGAAGYPPRMTHALGLRQRISWLGSDLRTGWAALLERRPFIAGVVAFFVSLRPVWWVLRGIAIYALLETMMNWRAYGPFTWVLLSSIIVVSVQFGRGRWMPSRWLRGAAVAINVVALVCVPWLLVYAMNQVASRPTAVDEWVPPSGLSLDGYSVGNIFAYDAEGNPIDQVQLFDQNGNPLNLVDEANGPAIQVFDTVLVPSADVVGRVGWNVYPLQHVSYNDQGNLGESFAPDFPHPNVRALAGVTETSTTDSEGALAEQKPTQDPEDGSEPKP